MSGARFIRFYPSDWRSGCIGLTLEEEGFYVRACAHFYETGRRLPMNDFEAASRLMVDVRMYRRLRKKLVEKGKLHERDDGYAVPRAERELQRARKAAGEEAGADVDSAWDSAGAEHEDGGATVESRSDFVPTPVRLRRDFRETSKQSLPELCQKNTPDQGPFTEPERIEEKNTPLPPKGGPTPGEALRAFEAYNAMALRAGLQQAARLTPDRQRKVIARLRDYGLAGWDVALANVERSSFLRGRNDKGWRANLDWLLQASSFAKAHDGAYGNGAHAEQPKAEQTPIWRRETEEQMQARVLAEMEREFAQCQ